MRVLCYNISNASLNRILLGNKIKSCPESWHLSYIINSEAVAIQLHLTSHFSFPILLFCNINNYLKHDNNQRVWWWVIKVNNFFISNSWNLLNLKPLDPIRLTTSDNLTLRISRPSSRVCLKGPISTSLINSFCNTKHSTVLTSGLRSHDYLIHLEAKSNLMLREYCC